MPSAELCYLLLPTLTQTLDPLHLPVPTNLHHTLLDPELLPARTVQMITLQLWPYSPFNKPQPLLAVVLLKKPYPPLE